jgi:hypothetical protein
MTNRKLTIIVVETWMLVSLQIHIEKYKSDLYQ